LSQLLSKNHISQFLNQIFNVSALLLDDALKPVTFSYAAPAAWNSLPPSLQELSDTASFKRNLTLLFQRAFYL